MSSMKRCSRGAARLVLLALTASCLSMVGAAPAGSHALVTGTDPVDGAVVTALPERFTVFLGRKPATIEGDPIRVYGPTGQRVDLGDATLAELEGDDRNAAAMSVGLSPQAAASGGDLRVALRIVSADSHLIAGSFGFRLDEPAGLSQVGVAAVGPTGPGRMARDEPPPGQWPKIVFVAGVALATVGALGRRSHRSRRSRPDATAGRRVAGARRAGVVSGPGTRAWTD